MELAVLWLVVWFIGIWAIPWIVVVAGVALSAALDNAWSAMAIGVSFPLALFGFGYAVYQFVLQIISVVTLIT